jgi:hypothetical protein
MKMMMKMMKMMMKMMKTMMVNILIFNFKDIDCNYRKSIYENVIFGL